MDIKSCLYTNIIKEPKKNEKKINRNKCKIC